jgi:hypothetical protein
VVAIHGRQTDDMEFIKGLKKDVASILNPRRTLLESHFPDITQFHLYYTVPTLLPEYYIRLLDCAPDIGQEHHGAKPNENLRETPLRVDVNANTLLYALLFIGLVDRILDGVRYVCLQIFPDTVRLGLLGTDIVP